MSKTKEKRGGNPTIRRIYEDCKEMHFMQDPLFTQLAKLKLVEFNSTAKIKAWLEEDPSKRFTQLTDKPNIGKGQVGNLFAAVGLDTPSRVRTTRGRGITSQLKELRQRICELEASVHDLTETLTRHD